MLITFAGIGVYLVICVLLAFEWAPEPQRYLFHNSNVFCSRIIHILYTVCAKIKIIPAPKG